MTAPSQLRDYVSDPRNRARLLRVAGRVVPAEAEDALHDAVVQALASPSEFRGEAQVGTWLHRVVVNAALMRRRRALAQARRLERAAHDGAEVAWMTGRGEAPDAGTALERAQAVRHLRAAITALPVHYREVACSYLLDEQPPQAVARQLCIGAPALRTRAARARRMLAAALAA